MTTIAIIDDDASVRRATDAMLRSLGYATAAYESAEHFLKSGRMNETSCVVSDVRMPGMGGIELQGHLIKNGHRLPFIFMTAFPEERARISAVEAGAVGFLTKPFSQQSLIDCLNTALQASAHSSEQTHH
jgi:FixJ family two-component response regulator